MYHFLGKCLALEEKSGKLKGRTFAETCWLFKDFCENDIFVGQLKDQRL